MINGCSRNCCAMRINIAKLERYTDPHMRQPHLLLILSLLWMACAQERSPADLVIMGGKIYTADSLRPEAEAVAVRDERIVCVGTNEEVGAWLGDATEVIDLEGKTMTPGFIESHGHLLGVGYNAMQLNLMAV